MKKIKLTILLSFIFVTLSYSQHQEYYLFTGTYTKQTSEGIYLYKFNALTGELTHVTIGKGVKNPAFLDVAPNKHFIYSVGELENGGVVSSLEFDKKNKTLILKNTVSSGGEGPCHIAIDKTGKWAIVANYRGGSLSVLPIKADGSLDTAIQTIQHIGHSINLERQEKPHVHSINIAPNNKDVFVADLGTDKIHNYTLDAQTGKLTPAKIPFIKSAPGAGPRHFTFHPNEKFAYVIEELTASVTGYRYTSGTLEAFQTIAALPADYTGRKWSADIHISPDGKFLYVSNRAHESLTIYKIDAVSGSLTLVGLQPVMGKTPRNFMIDPTGNFILVANQESDNIVVFKRNLETGLLENTGKEVKVSMPSCLKMIPVE